MNNYTAYDIHLGLCAFLLLIPLLYLPALDEGDSIILRFSEPTDYGLFNFMHGCYSYGLIGLNLCYSIY